jgi:hypothetical protein
MSADDVKTELGRALSRTARTQLASTVDAVRAAEQGELEPDVDFFVAMTVRWDVHWHPVHWLNFKTDSAKRRDRDALKLIEQVEQRFRPYAVGRGGRRVGSKNRPRDRPPEELRMQQLAPELRGLIKHAKRLCREGRNPSPALGRIADLLTPSPSAKDIETFSVEVGPPRRLRKSPEEIVRWVVAKHLGIGLSAAKNLIKRPR